MLNFTVHRSVGRELFTVQLVTRNDNFR